MERRAEAGRSVGKGGKDQDGTVVVREFTGPGTRHRRGDHDVGIERQVRSVGFDGADRKHDERVFPIQVAILLSEPGEDFTGGELVLTEQRPRMQSRVEVPPVRRGDGVAFAVNVRPVNGARGSYRVRMRHGVSRLRSGERFTLGVIFHDAA